MVSLSAVVAMGFYGEVGSLQVFIKLTEFLNPAGAGLTLNFSSLQTLAAILQAEPKNSNHAQRAWFSKPK